MATSPRGGQRSNLSSSSGRKQRSPTTIGHTGSRVDPSHTTEQARETRSKKSAAQPKAALTATPAAKAKSSGKNLNLTAKKKHKKAKK